MVTAVSAISGQMDKTGNHQKSGGALASAAVVSQLLRRDEHRRLSEPIERRQHAIGAELAHLVVNLDVGRSSRCLTSAELGQVELVAPDPRELFGGGPAESGNVALIGAREPCRRPAGQVVQTDHTALKIQRKQGAMRPAHTLLQAAVEFPPIDVPDGDCRVTGPFI
jgi:hypothetical protein